MSQEMVDKVFNALLGDEELLLDLTTVIGKAASRAKVDALTTDDLAGIFTSLASLAQTDPTQIFGIYDIWSPGEHGPA